MNIAEKHIALVQIAQELINIPSVTGSERAVLESLENMLRDMKMMIEREEVSDGRWNIYAGWNQSTDVVFCTHVDTVPPFFPAQIDGDTLSGRGACDTKGIIAAMLSAGDSLIQDGHTPAYLFVVGEETDSIGAKTAAASGRKAEYIIVGEPTDNILASGHKGVVSYTITVEGKAAHSAYPHQGVSALHIMLDILQDIRTADWGKNTLLGEATFNVGMIDGGVAMNTLAPAAKATVMHRIVDDAEERKRQVRAIVDGRAVVQFHSISQPQILTTVEGFAKQPVSFGTDIPYLCSMGKCLLFGPGSIHEAHTAHERISIAAINEAKELYIRLYHALRRP
ncbi:MAG: M20/M25/M40 family metallo-hydrolase [Bacteroidota bacterium]